MFNERDVKNIMKTALRNEYGFAPTLKEIALLEVGEQDGIYHYILAEIGGYEYRYDSTGISRV